MFSVILSYSKTSRKLNSKKPSEKMIREVKHFSRCKVCGNRTAMVTRVDEDKERVGTNRIKVLEKQ